ncbi:pro-adrenomedullin-like [Pseudophryne corroboree]|uniref:pro-adrenomedullin-like n=1 Tax=Pseudophryne corroboree TaxID=495146 RepID=UPI0030815DDD
MAQCGCLIVFFLVVTINVCNSHWMDSRDRRMPPPVVSFLEKLRDLSNQRLKRDVRDDYLISTGKESEEDSQIGNSMDNDQTMLSSLLRLREKRYAPSINTRGCHLGTCQVQNLANMLYRLGKNNNKDVSNKDTKDPLGYGRRRRSMMRNKDWTDLSQPILAT